MTTISDLHSAVQNSDFPLFESIVRAQEKNYHATLALLMGPTHSDTALIVIQYVGVRLAFLSKRVSYQYTPLEDDVVKEHNVLTLATKVILQQKEYGKNIREIYLFSLRAQLLPYESMAMNDGLLIPVLVGREGSPRENVVARLRNDIVRHLSSIGVRLEEARDHAYLIKQRADFLREEQGEGALYALERFLWKVDHLPLDWQKRIVAKIILEKIHNLTPEKVHHVYFKYKARFMRLEESRAVRLVPICQNLIKLEPYLEENAHGRILAAQQKLSSL